jgi:hypothetical protein
VAGDQVGDLLQFIVAGLWVGVGQKQKVVDPVKLLSVDLGGCGEFEHPFQ